MFQRTRQKHDPFSPSPKIIQCHFHTRFKGRRHGAHFRVFFKKRFSGYHSQPLSKVGQTRFSETDTMFMFLPFPRPQGFYYLSVKTRCPPGEHKGLGVRDPTRPVATLKISCSYGSTTCKGWWRLCNAALVRGFITLSLQLTFGPAFPFPWTEAT